VSRAACPVALRTRLLAQAARLAENSEPTSRHRPMVERPRLAHHAVAIRAMRSLHPASHPESNN
jgi:hypothetical protein